MSIDTTSDPTDSGGGSGRMPTLGGSGDDGVGLEPSPIRFSGIASLVLGMFSVIYLIAPPLVVLPMAAAAFGLFALRPSGTAKPIGLTPARIGLVLAAGFGACGFFISHYRGQALGQQAEYFARQYLQLVAAGHDEYAVELRKPSAGRHVPSMPLKQLYQLDSKEFEQLDQFQATEATKLVQRHGDQLDWQLSRAPAVYRTRGIERVELRFEDRSGIVDRRLRLDLSYEVDWESGEGQWVVDAFDFEQPRSNLLSEL